MTIQLITSDKLAESLGYSGPNHAFRTWCTQMRITPVPGRRGVYDPVLVRRRLDEAQGLALNAIEDDAQGGLVAQRRARRGQG